MLQFLSAVTSGIFRFVPALLLAAGVANAASAEQLPPIAGKSHGFNITVTDASAAVREFGKQSGVQIMVSGELLKGRKLNPVTGEHSTDEALRILLADSGLTHRYIGEQGVALVPVESKENARTSTYGAGTDGIRLALVQNPPSESEAATHAGETGEAEIVVQESRIDGLINRGLLQGGVNAPLYYDVITREDIERMGVTSVEELFRMIPQTSSAVTSLQRAESYPNMTFGASITFSTMGLRGFGSDETVIMINGRALPRSGTSGGPDLARIPLAAIERIDILPYAGSAIYGSGAVGGAINIILRKEYTGKDLNLYVGTSTDGGAEEVRLNYLDGRTFNNGRTSLTTTFSFQNREPLTLGERKYLQRALDRFGPNSGVMAPTGYPAFEQYMIPTMAGPRAIIALSSPVGDLGIPGAPGARYAVVPAGTSAAQSFELTPESFISTANQVGDGSRYARTNIYEPIESTILTAQVEHEFINNRLSLYSELTTTYNRRNYTYPQSLQISLNANHPLNPFRNNVTPGFVGRAVTVFLDPTDAPDSRTIAEYRIDRAVVGLTGRINQNWDWSADITFDRSRSTFLGTDPTSRIGQFVTSSALPLPGYGTVEDRYAVYPILADHAAHPNPLSDSSTYFLIQRYSWSYGDQREANARLTGDLFSLPAGPFRVSATAKYQDWEATIGQYYAYASTGNRMMGSDSDLARDESTNGRNLWQGTVEFSLPIVSRQWQPVPIESLELQGSASYESIETLTGATVLNPQDQRYVRKADSQVIAMKLQPTADFAFRASYSTAFNPPRWGMVHDNVRDNPPLPGIFPDAARGNTLQTTTWIWRVSGNPNLKPEVAKSQNLGLILTPRFLAGFSMTVDYWRTRKTDAVVRTDLLRVWSDPNYTLGVTRADPTPEEAAMGWLGPVILFEDAPFNAASVKTEGVDVRLSHVVETSAHGTFHFNANGSFTNNFLQQDVPSDDPRNTLNASGPLKWRAMGSVTWNKGGLTTSVTGRYTHHYFTPFTAPTEVYPSANRFDGDHIPGTMLWDLQLAYELPATNVGGLWNELISGTRWTLGVNNIFNDPPPYITGISSSSGSTSFYSRTSDPRQRFVYLSIRKGF